MQAVLSLSSQIHPHDAKATVPPFCANLMQQEEKGIILTLSQRKKSTRDKENNVKRKETNLEP